jgi:hypothetical protein
MGKGREGGVPRTWNGLRRSHQWITRCSTASPHANTLLADATSRSPIPPPPAPSPSPSPSPSRWYSATESREAPKSTCERDAACPISTG